MQKSSNSWDYVFGIIGLVILFLVLWGLWALIGIDEPDSDSVLEGCRWVSGPHGKTFVCD